MATAIQSNFRIRKNLGRIQRVIEVPNLIDIQKSSYDKFLQSTIPQNDRQETGLQAVAIVAPLSVASPGHRGLPRRDAYEPIKCRA